MLKAFHIVHLHSIHSAALYKRPLVFYMGLSGKVVKFSSRCFLVDLQLPCDVTKTGSSDEQAFNFSVNMPQALAVAKLEGSVRELLSAQFTAVALNAGFVIGPREESISDMVLV